MTIPNTSHIFFISRQFLIVMFFSMSETPGKYLSVASVLFFSHLLALEWTICKVCFSGIWILQSCCDPQFVFGLFPVKSFEWKRGPVGCALISIENIEGIFGSVVSQKSFQSVDFISSWKFFMLSSPKILIMDIFQYISISGVGSISLRHDSFVCVGGLAKQAPIHSDSIRVFVKVFRSTYKNYVTNNMIT